MDATQQIEDTFFEEEDDTDEENALRERKKERTPLAALKVFKNSYIPEMEVPLYLGENVLGRDPASCCFPLEARSVSSRHAIISISVFPAKNKGPTVTEALLWDLGSLNGTRKGHFKLTPHVRYALTEGDSLVLADLPCQYIGMKSSEKKVKMDTTERGIRQAKDPAPKVSGSEKITRGDAEVEKKVLLPPVPLFSNEEKRCLQSPETTPKQPKRTLVPESDSDSEGEKRGQRERVPFLASDSASSDLSSPTCSTFLTPASKVIPESEDESAITPSSSLAGRLKKAEDHSIASSDSPKPVPLAFNIDSDTDVEEDETDESKREQDAEMQATPVNPATGNVESNTDLVSKSGPETSTVSRKQGTDIPANFIVDSDTDVEEDESVRTKTAPPSGSEVALEKKSEPVLCPMGYPAHAELDSDTDVEDSSDLTNTETSSSELVKPDVITPNENKNKEFCIESDTDAEDEDALMTAAVSRSKLDTSDSKASAKPGTEFHMDSGTDAEESEKSTEVVEPLSESDIDDDDPFKPKQVKLTETSKAPEAKVLKPHSDSDTDIEDNAVQASKPLITTEAHTATENNTETRDDGPSGVSSPAKRDVDDYRLGSDTDVHEEEEGLEEREEKGAEREAGTWRCSTPRESDVPEENMETQAFFSPSQTFKRPAPISAHPSSVCPDHISPDCDDYVVAETQSFVSDVTLEKSRLSLEARGPLPSDQDFFQLGLSDSNLQQETESQRLGGVERDWDLQPTQLYAMGNHEDKEGRSSVRDKGLDLEATQAYTAEVEKEEEEHEEKLLDGQVHSSLSAAETQVFRVQEAEKNDIVFEGPSGEIGDRKGGGAAAEDEEEEEAALVDSHLSTAETVIIARSPREEEQTQPFTHLTTLPFEEAEFSTEARSSGTSNNRTGSDAKVHVAIAETLPIEVEGVDEEHTEPIDSDPTAYDAVAETLPLSEDEEIEEQPSSESSPHVRPPGVERQEEDQTQSIEADADGRSALSVIQPLHGDEEESVERLETKKSTHGRPRRAGLIEKEKESTSEAKSQRRPRRGKWEEVEQTQPIVLDALDQTDVAVTQPVCDSDEGQEKEEQNENSSSGRPRRGRQVQKPIVPVADLQVSAAKTQPINENDSRQEGEPTTESISSRRSRRSRMIDKEQKQPIDPPTEAPQTVAENLPRDEESVEQSTAQPGRGLRGRGGRGRGASTRGKGKTPIGREGRRKRGRAEPDEEGMGDEEGERKESGRKSMRQKAIKKKEERGEEEQQQTESRQETTEVRGHLDRQERKEKHQEREKMEKNEIEMKRMDQEKKEQLQAEDEERKRMEREKERKDIEKREQADKDRLEQERMEKEKKEQLEKERKEREESERLEKEHKEKLEKERRELERDRLEQERKKREEMESLEREKQARKERDRQEKDRLEREREEETEQEEKERLEREMGEKEPRELEKKELERRQERNMEEQEAVEKKRRGGRGKPRTSVAKRGKKIDKEEKNEADERSEQSGNAESTIQECGEAVGEKEKDEGEERGSEQTEKENEGKPKRGRRPTRKSAVPVEDGPAKRTRSRSNSSNSASSEQSTPVQEGSGRGRGRGRKRKVAEEVGDSSGTTVGRRRTATVPSSNLEDTKQGGRGRKSSKMEEAVKEGPDAATAGRGRAKRGGAKHPGSGDVKVEAVNDHQIREESESISTSDDGVLSQASSRGRKRGSDSSSTTAASPPSTPKTPRRSIASHSPKILFTGMTDEYWEEVLVRLGGSLANGVGDMTHLVTDKVRRTVKFLCAVARGVPIVTTQWLAKSGKAGIFLSPSKYLVKDMEQEKKFNFSLEESLRTASHQPLLQGYEIHVTPSVKPEPSHMKDIIICCGARYLPRMPAAHKPQTVVVSCEEDRAFCERVLSLSLPVVTAEFLLTGILQQKVDLNAHVLLISPATASKPIAQGRKK